MEALGVIRALVACYALKRAYHILPPMTTLYRLSKPLFFTPQQPNIQRFVLPSAIEKVRSRKLRGFGESMMACSSYSDYIDHIASDLIAGEMKLRHN